MIKRFSLYGFLKNLQFYEPFLILFFLQLGLSFLQIGLLISFRTVCINIMEIPSGAVADLYGRRSSMAFSLISYIISFMVFFMAGGYYELFPAMFFFSIGEAFRTGTHKAMIFDWLRHNDMLEDRVRVYGYTRSWSKIGSSVSVVISAVIVICAEEYKWVFLFTIIPYCAGVWNILQYPPYLNKRADNRSMNIKKIFAHLLNTMKEVIQNSSIKNLIIMNMGYEGVFDTAKTYLQPVIKIQALALAGHLFINKKDTISIVIGGIYFIIYIISAAAARKSHRLVTLFQTENRAMKSLILISATVTLAASAGLWLSYTYITIICLVLLFVLQNVWRPIVVSGYGAHADSTIQATILSVESQSKSAGIFLIAPLAGYLADSFGIFLVFLFLSIVLYLLWVYEITFKK